jgi:hypothetical protein
MTEDQLADAFIALERRVAALERRVGTAGQPATPALVTLSPPERLVAAPDPVHEDLAPAKSLAAPAPAPPTPPPAPATDAEREAAWRSTGEWNPNSAFRPDGVDKSMSEKLRDAVDLRRFEVREDVGLEKARQRGFR